MNEKDLVKQMFTKNKEAYVTSHTHSNPRDLIQIKEWIKPKERMIALDIATGGGHVAKQLSPDVRHIYATDLTKGMLQNTAKHLANYPNIHYVVADAEELPFIDHTFDVVTCRIAAHHFPHPETFITEVARVLKKGGMFLFIDNIASEISEYDLFINKLEKLRDPSHVRALNISQWKQLLLQNKLSIEREANRKKTLPFDDWLNRAQPTESAKELVKDLFMNAKKEIQSYYNVKLYNNKIISFSIDEWVALCRK